MTITFQDLLDRRQAERQAELEALALVEDEKRERIATERSKVFWLFQRDILKGATLPRGASIAARVSNEHGHQISVCFPGNLSIDAEHTYTVLNGALLASGPRYNQRWTAHVHPCGAQKMFDDFIDAALWLLPQSDETPSPSKELHRPIVIASLIGRKVKDVAHIAGCAVIITDDGLTLDYESDTNIEIAIRCFCGSPVEMGNGGDAPPLYCSTCGEGWDNVGGFLQWKAEKCQAWGNLRDDIDEITGYSKADPIVAEQPAMNKLLEAAQAALEAMCDMGQWEDEAPYGWHEENVQPAENELLTQLARYRCTCGKFPIEGHVRCWWMVRCCGHEWESWEEFLAWREEEDAKAGA